MTPIALLHPVDALRERNRQHAFLMAFARWGTVHLACLMVRLRVTPEEHRCWLAEDPVYRKRFGWVRSDALVAIFPHAIGTGEHSKTRTVCRARLVAHLILNFVPRAAADPVCLPLFASHQRADAALQAAINRAVEWLTYHAEAVRHAHPTLGSLSRAEFFDVVTADLDELLDDQARAELQAKGVHAPDEAPNSLDGSVEWIAKDNKSVVEFPAVAASRVKAIRCEASAGVAVTTTP
jgi:hypothetical protein